MKRVIFFIGLFFMLTVPAYAQECTAQNIQNLNSLDPINLERMNEKCNQALADMQKAVKPHVDELNKMNAAIDAFQKRITQIETDVAKKATEIAQGEKELEGSLVIASDRIRRFYMRSYISSPMYLLLSSANVGSVLRTLGYQQAAVNEDKKIITQTAITVKDLEDKKASLESEKASLAALKADTDKRAASVRALVSQANAYESQLQGYIAQISARQQEFLNQKLAGLGIPLFAISGGGCSSDLTNGKDPGFSGGFGLFTYGVPNRVGLNQYGAYGRAKAGQSSEEILHAYYNFDSLQSVDTNMTIRVNDSNGYNSGNIIWSGPLNDYVKRIYEVPNDWPYESIKAQVIAVRSYVVAATNNGSSSICANQHCQVFQSNPKGGQWEQGVNDTGGNVMVLNNQPIKAFFSSTHGGYVFATGDLAGWSSTPYTKRAVDTTGPIGSFGDLQSKAYDKDSPWFYCDWGGRSAYGNTAWLKSDEIADIVNVILLAQQDSSAQPHLVQVDKANPDGVDTWDAGTVRSKLGGSGFSSISSMSISADFSTGRTSSVTVSGDAGTRTFDGNTFKTYFNLRAPANIQIVGPLFNVERH